MSTYPIITKEGAMLALSASVDENYPGNYNAERLAHEFTALAKMARAHTGLQVKRCNAPMTERDESRQRNLRKRIEAKVREVYMRQPVRIEYHGDPRGGATVTLTFRKHERDGTREYDVTIG